MASQMIDVPILHQYSKNLPTGCEACSAWMLLKWKGIDVTVEQVVDRLIKEPKPYQDPNGFKGGNPNRAFVGDPYDKESFGTFHGPITALLESFTPSLDLTGSSFEGILLQMRHSKTPIIIWCTLEMKEPKVTDIWTDCKDEGVSIQWQSPEHCLLLVGYNQEQVFVNDPHTGKRDSYDRLLFEKRFQQMGYQAVTIL